MKTALAVSSSSSRSPNRPRKTLPAVPDSDSSPYAAGRLRETTDTERSRAEALCERHPEFARLGHDQLLQVADTYLDEADHALRSELPMGAVGYRRQESDDTAPRWSDEGCVSFPFCLFSVGTIFLGIGLAAHPVSTAGKVACALSLLAGAALMGVSFEWDGEGEKL
ncbi:MAG: hypothetical protein IVW54_22905 [Candidatus Binataceae bacterium]|nr:hypothetical protein [Candidatus Binataceae bacterium]